MKLIVAAILVPLYVMSASLNCSDSKDENSVSLSYHTSPLKPVDLDILAADGIKLKATYYSAGKAGPAILLLHQCNMNRKSWQSLATSLANNGIHVLTFDYRGYGETAASGDLYQHIAADVDSALAKLMLQPGIDKKRIAAGGASCGVYNSMQLAIRNDKIKALFLLTGPIPEQGVAYIKSHPAVPIFAIEDGNQAAAVKVLDAVMVNSKNPASTMKAYPNGAHGVPIFDKHPEIIPTVTNWLVNVLK